GGEATRSPDVAAQEDDIRLQRALIRDGPGGGAGGVVDDHDGIGPAVVGGEGVEAVGQQLLGVVGADDGSDPWRRRGGMGGRVPGAVVGPRCGMVNSASCGGRGRVSGARPVYGAERLWPTTPCDEGVKVPRRSSMDRCDPARD